MDYLDTINRQISEAESHLNALKEKRTMMTTVERIFELTNISEVFSKVGLQYISHRVLTNDISSRVIRTRVDVYVKTYKAPRFTNEVNPKLQHKAISITEKWNAMCPEISMEINPYIFAGDGSIQLQSVYLIYEY